MVLVHLLGDPTPQSCYDCLVRLNCFCVHPLIPNCSVTKLNYLVKFKNSFTFHLNMITLNEKMWWFIESEVLTSGSVNCNQHSTKSYQHYIVFHSLFVLRLSIKTVLISMTIDLTTSTQTKSLNQERQLYGKAAKLLSIICWSYCRSNSTSSLNRANDQRLSSYHDNPTLPMEYRYVSV